MLNTVRCDPIGAHIPPVYETKKIAAIVTAVARTAEAWKLSGEEVAALFDISLSKWSCIKVGAYKGQLNEGQITRASLLIGLFKGLRLLFDGSLTYGWPKAVNSGVGFNGKTPVQIM